MKNTLFAFIVLSCFGFSHVIGLTPAQAQGIDGYTDFNEFSYSNFEQALDGDTQIKKYERTQAFNGNRSYIVYLKGSQLRRYRIDFDCPNQSCRTVYFKTTQHEISDFVTDGSSTPATLTLPHVVEASYSLPQRLSNYHRMLEAWHQAFAIFYPSEANQTDSHVNE